MEKREYYDHLGNAFASQDEMCRYWGVLEATYSRRRKRGMTLKEALLMPTNREEVMDHLGNVYKTFCDMCYQYNIGTDTVNERLKRGWTLQESLTKPLSKCRTMKYVDHTGQVFRSLSSMCAYYGISRALYKYRLNVGWTQEKALTTPAYAKKLMREEELRHGQCDENVC